MKKIISLLLCLALLGCVLAGCKTEPEEPVTEPTTEPTQAVTDPTDEATDPTEPEEPTETEEPEPETEPHEAYVPLKIPSKVTPLMWHATSENGGELWLLGTIHVGGDNISSLPQELLEAFVNADALAVECNILGIYDMSMAQQAKLERMSMYTDGTKIMDHISPELYEDAKELLEDEDAYIAMMNSMKPMMWASMIEQIGAAYAGLYSEMGMDMILLHSAYASEKEIREVESVMGQYEMLYGFSDRMQEIYLSEAVEAGIEETSNLINDLYALWCMGDQARLEEELLGEIDEEKYTDPEDIAALEEYELKMMTERNALMVETAASYLDAGDNVFYAVGLAHMLGEDGIIQCLMDMGYTVELVDYAGL